MLPKYEVPRDHIRAKQIGHNNKPKDNALRSTITEPGVINTEFDWLPSA